MTVPDDGQASNRVKPISWRVFWWCRNCWW